MLGVLRAIWNGLQTFFQMLQLIADYIVKGLAFLWSGVQYLFEVIAALPPWLIGIATLVIVLAVVKLILGR